MLPEFTFWDKTLVVFFLVLSLAGFAANLSLEGKTPQKYVVVHVDNEKVAEFSFTEYENQEYAIPFGPQKEHVAILEIGEGRVRLLPISEDLCPLGICSHTGWIEKSYETIVCVPNRIVVSFRGDPDHDVNLDGVTY